MLAQHIIYIQGRFLKFSAGLIINTFLYYFNLSASPSYLPAPIVPGSKRQRTDTDESNSTSASTSSIGERPTPTFQFRLGISWGMSSIRIG